MGVAKEFHILMGLGVFARLQTLCLGLPMHLLVRLVDSQHGFSVFSPSPILQSLATSAALLTGDQHIKVDDVSWLQLKVRLAPFQENIKMHWEIIEYQQIWLAWALFLDSYQNLEKTSCLSSKGG